MDKDKVFIVRVADRLLKTFCDPFILEGIQGDLLESFQERKERKGSLIAEVIYFAQAIGFLRRIFKKQRKQNNLEAMLRNHFIATVRSIKKQKFYTAINALGLIIGMVAGFLILQYVYNELSYDKFFANKENIYRLQTNRYNNGILSTQWAGGAAGAGKNLADNIPEIVDFVNLRKSAAEINYQKKYFELTHAFYAKENFFQVFSIPLLRGVDSLVLKEPFTVVLSESFARKMFGDEDPVGKILQQNDNTDYKVTGVFQDLPSRSHMKFDLLYSFATYLSFYGEDSQTEWNWDGFHNYVVLQPGADLAVVNEKITQVIQDQMGEEMESRNYFIEIVLQPLEKIHLISRYIGEIKPTGNEKTTYFLLIIGFFVLVIAWINYINLTTARALDRSKEVGVRKVLGSSQGQLVGQFMFESVFLNLLCFLAAFIAIILLYPVFNQLVENDQAYTWPDSTFFWFALFSTFVVGIILSGFYPSFVLSRFQPVKVLKGKLGAAAGGNMLRKSLVTFQFLASAILITSTYIVYRQMDHMQNQDLGVAIEQNLIVHTPIFATDSISDIYDGIFKNRLEQRSAVKKVTVSSSVPGKQPNWNAGGIRLITQAASEANQYRVIACDDNYVDFFNLEIIAGRDLDASFGTESSNILLNEQGLAQLGIAEYDEAINKKVLFWGDTFNIVGIVKNYHHESPKMAFDAYIYRYYESPGGMYSIKINTTNTADVIEDIEKDWQVAFGDKIFNFEFLDDYYNEQYKAETRFGSIFGLFSALAILVACLGLFGLSSFITNLRAKEIGVRKVLGASTRQLLLLLTSDFMKLVLLAIILAIPVNWWLMQSWLSDFETRISLNLLVFLIPGMLIIAFAVLTVIYHTTKTAVLNPARTLKDE
ncbi:MAG: ABC transporter permease [Bacteroidota bacterium]